MPKYLKGVPPRGIRKAKKRGRIKGFFFLLFCTLVISLAVSLMQIDKKLMPSILAIANNRAAVQMNRAINEALEKITKEEQLTAADFYMAATDQNGQISSLSANTVLVNDICSRLAVEISDRLESMEPEKVSVPIGTLFGFQVFSMMGPSYSVTLKPTGYTVIDYESEFSSVGINQINFQIWLIARSKIKIVNPIQNAEITVERKISLVNSVFSGQVPDTYFGGNPLQ